MTSREEHIRNIRKHDITYEYSDDSYYWRKGRVEQAAIESAEKQDPQLAGMFAQYSKWYWGADRKDGKPDPFEDELPTGRQT